MKCTECGEGHSVTERCPYCKTLTVVEDSTAEYDALKETYHATVKERDGIQASYSGLADKYDALKVEVQKLRALLAESEKCGMAECARGLELESRLALVGPLVEAAEAVVVSNGWTRVETLKFALAKYKAVEETK